MADIKIDKEEIKSFETQVIDFDEESVFIVINGWRMRVYFKDKKINPYSYKGRYITIGYEGDLSDVYTLKLLELTETVI